mmetsp:Transcript_16856/g.47863  ORF Transcript_16856/g.47863 Transcript_16856/m.47863 type:complete len:216 (+) Transcript_16856:650-1297(+)
MPPARHQHEHRHARRPDVRGTVVAKAIPGQPVLFGSHEGGRAALVLQQPAGRALHGHAQVGKLEPWVLRRVGHEEVVRLNVAVDEVLGVQVFDAVQHLVRDHQHGLQAKLAAANVEQVLEGGPQQIHDHHIVVALDVAVMHRSDARDSLEVFDQLRLIHEHRVLGLHAFALHRQLLPGLRIHCKVDVTERAGPQLAAQAVDATDPADLSMVARHR